MLHETAVAWLQRQLTLSRPRQSWRESRISFGKRLCKAAKYVNDHYDADALCRELPERIATLILREGDRLRK